MEATLTRHDYLEEVCATCARRLPAMYCPKYHRVMPDHVPACEAWRGEDDD
ncbi:MAG: hypothetical protein IBX61_09435 [Thermoleophilia bacterium]|nr:hypothetical protein [Thermoleophilia bacterium]